MAENPKESAGQTKLQMQLVPVAAKRQMALALEHGAKKYGAWNWRDAGISLMTYVGAMQRHLDAIQTGEDIDPESGISHIGHILAGAAIVADAAEVGMLHDNRPGCMDPAQTIRNALAAGASAPKGGLFPDGRRVAGPCVGFPL